MLHDIGFSLMDFVKRSGAWPQSLNDLWVRGVMRDRNRYNRFHCPVTGATLLYIKQEGDIEALPSSMILIATERPVPTNQGLRYGYFTAALRVGWSESSLKPGDLAPD